MKYIHTALLALLLAGAAHAQTKPQTKPNAQPQTQTRTHTVTTPGRR